MNKLASIFYLQSKRFQTVNPKVILRTSEEYVRSTVRGFYYNVQSGWVMRCAEMPDLKARMEPCLPWDIAHNEEELVNKILRLQKEIGHRYVVFCHKTNNMIGGGTMMVEGKGVVIEAGIGGPKELSAMYRGKTDPQQLFEFNPGMLSFKHSGENVLDANDLHKVRTVERSLDWKELNAVTDPVVVEFSILDNQRLYVHDLRIVT